MATLQQPCYGVHLKHTSCKGTYFTTYLHFPLHPPFVSLHLFSLDTDSPGNEEGCDRSIKGKALLLKVNPASNV